MSKRQITKAVVKRLASFLGNFDLKTPLYARVIDQKDHNRALGLAIDNLEEMYQIVKNKNGLNLQELTLYNEKFENAVRLLLLSHLIRVNESFDAPLQTAEAAR